MRLAPPARQVVTVYHNLFIAQETNLGSRVHPCFVRLHDLTTTTLVKRLQEGRQSLLALGVPEEELLTGSVLSEWS